MESSRSIVARRAAALLVILVAGALIALRGAAARRSLLALRPQAVGLLQPAQCATASVRRGARRTDPDRHAPTSRASIDDRLVTCASAPVLRRLRDRAAGADALRLRARCTVRSLLRRSRPVTATLILVGFAAYLATSRSRALITATGLTVISIVGSALTTFWYVTPRSHHECARLAEPIRRDLCRMNFALRMDDAALCDTIDFDPSRWSCTYQIAERKGEPELCDRIAPPCRHRSPGLVCDPDFYRNTCFLVVARKLRDPRLCEQMTPGELQARCLEQTR